MPLPCSAAPACARLGMSRPASCFKGCSSSTSVGSPGGDLIWGARPVGESLLQTASAHSAHDTRREGLYQGTWLDAFCEVMPFKRVRGLKSRVAASMASMRGHKLRSRRRRYLHPAHLALKPSPPLKLLSLPQKTRSHLGGTSGGLGDVLLALLGGDQSILQCISAPQNEADARELTSPTGAASCETSPQSHTFHHNGVVEHAHASFHRGGQT